MSNPWEDIKLDDYENHMSLDNVYQLQVLNQMMKEQFAAYDIENVMILGIAGGNGLEHIDTNRIKKVYGVDVNQSFLTECVNRYGGLGENFEPVCADLLAEELQLPQSDLIVANLLVEYIGYDCFQRVVSLVDPKYVSCIIQINAGDSFVSDSPYLHVFDCLEKVHHPMEEDALVNSMSEIGCRKTERSERMLPNGKKLVRIDFVR